MSFEKFKDTIEQGDTVILYMRHNNMHAIQVQPRIKNRRNEWVENVFQTTYGALKVQSLVGKKYGSKVSLSKGWAYVLYPTPELWTLTLPHRTQIIYTPDISMIIFQLEIKPGSVVFECGTGSGSLSHALIRCIMPHGHLYTFDFHEHRVSVVREEFESHGIGQFVSVEQRDVCQDGFGTELNGKADAVFLDIPDPWEAVPHAAATFKDLGGRLASFSPCIEQVQRTCEALKQYGFVELTTMECLQKELQVRMRAMHVLDLPQPKDGFPLEDTQIGARFSESQKPEDDAQKPKKAKKKQAHFVAGMSPVSMTGHTGYLTAATMPPIWARVSRLTQEQRQS